MYEVSVAGVVPQEDLQDMKAVVLAPHPVNTVLYGIADEAALYGLLDRLRALGLHVVEVRRACGFESWSEPVDVQPVDDERIET